MKSKKRLICSICAVFMIAFSLFLIPFSKLKDSSAETIPTTRFTSQTYQMWSGFSADLAALADVVASRFYLTTSKTDTFTLSFDTYGVRSKNASNEYEFVTFVGPLDISKNYPDGTVISSGYNFPDISASDSGKLINYYFKLRYATGSTAINYNYHFRALYLQNSNTSQVFNSNVVSVETGGQTVSPEYPNGIPNNPLLHTPFPFSLIQEASSSTTINYMQTISYNWIRFNDSLGNSLLLWIPFVAGDFDMSIMPFNFIHEVVYYNKLEDNQIYNEGYNAGYGVGSTEGYDSGYDIGYDTGFSNGETTGFGNGYNEGLETASETTFFGLIGATIDAPIKAFRGLFNFELLGVNMVSLITGLFTLCVIVCVVKLVLGGK